MYEVLRMFSLHIICTVAQPPPAQAVWLTCAYVEDKTKSLSQNSNGVGVSFINPEEDFCCNDIPLH